MSHRFILMALLLVAVACPVTLAQPAQAPVKIYTRADFINIEGSSLDDKIKRAAAQCKAGKLSDTCWLAYHFTPRNDARGDAFGGWYYRDGDGISLERRADPAQAAIFWLTDVSGQQPQIKRIKMLNLSEPYTFEKHPVYWLGAIDNAQSIAQLETHIRVPVTTPTTSAPPVAHKNELARSAVRALSQHESPRILPLLQELAQGNNGELQTAAINELGYWRTTASAAALIELYEKLPNETLKEAVIRSLGVTRERAATGKLQAIATSDASARLRKAAIRRLAQEADSYFVNE